MLSKGILLFLIKNMIVFFVLLLISVIKIDPEFVDSEGGTDITIFFNEKITESTWFCRFGEIVVKAKNVSSHSICCSSIAMDDGYYKLFVSSQIVKWDSINPIDVKAVNNKIKEFNVSSKKVIVVILVFIVIIVSVLLIMNSIRIPQPEEMPFLSRVKQSQQP